MKVNTKLDNGDMENTVYKYIENKRNSHFNRSAMI